MVYFAEVPGRGIFQYVAEAERIEIFTNSINSKTLLKYSEFLLPFHFNSIFEGRGNTKSTARQGVMPLFHTEGRKGCVVK